MDIFSSPLNFVYYFEALPSWTLYCNLDTCKLQCNVWKTNFHEKGTVRQSFLWLHIYLIGLLPKLAPALQKELAERKLAEKKMKVEKWETKSLILDKLPVERLIYSDKAIQTWWLFNYKVGCFAILRSSDSKNKIKLVCAAIHLRHQNSLRDSFIHFYWLIQIYNNFFLSAYKQQRLV